MAKPVKVGVVGFGYWGPNLVRNLDRAADARIVAACDLSQDNLDKLSALYPYVETTSDMAAFLADYDLDAVVVATSAPSHFVLAKQALEAGKHVYVEKPLTLTSADAEELVRLADSKGLVLMVGHLMEYHSGINWIRDYIASGELGEVLYLYAQRLNLGKVRKEENAFWSLAPHDVSIVLYLIGETPDSVSANGAAYLNDGVHDTVFANLHFPSGKMANIHVSWLDPHKVRKFTIVGTKKMLVFDDMEATEKIWIYDKGVEPAEALGYGEDLRLRFGDITVPFIKMSEPLALEIQHFLDCVDSGETPRSDGRDGLRVVRVLEAVDESMEAGGAPVDIHIGV
jgi:predicted dehydrogenase